MVYLDFAKAHDKVALSVLLQKIRTLGIGGTMGSWLGSFLLNRSQVVNVNGHISSSAQVPSGIPQGSVLGPLMFLIFVADMGSLSPCKSYLYVDDAKVLETIDSPDDIDKFQENLNYYYSWAQDNNMTYNNTKFVLLRYGKNQNLKEDYLYFTDEMNEIIDSHENQRDLGVQMSNNGRLEFHIDSIIKKAKQRIG